MGLVKSDWGTFAGFPLAFAVLVGSGIIIARGVWMLYPVFFSTWAVNPNTIISLIFAILTLIFGLLGLCSVVFKSPKCCVWGSRGCGPFIMLLFGDLLMRWYYWIEAMRGYAKTTNGGLIPALAWDPTAKEKCYMGLYTAGILMLLVLTFLLMSAFASMIQVLRVGGNGWERTNWRELREKESLLNYSGEPNETA